MTTGTLPLATRIRSYIRNRPGVNLNTVRVFFEDEGFTQAEFAAAFWELVGDGVLQFNVTVLDVPDETSIKRTRALTHE